MALGCTMSSAFVIPVSTHSIHTQGEKMLGSYTRTDKKGIVETMEETFQLFPRLKERLYQRGGTLSGANNKCWPSAAH
jgi:ABC-type branched-subunit amino acid transport system ATPase component